MKIQCECNKGTAKRTGNTVNRKSFAKRFVNTIKFMMPGIVLTLIPKCPVCFAAYIALGTGIGLSLTTATYIRMVLILLCVWSLSYFGIKKFLEIKHTK